MRFQTVLSHLTLVTALFLISSAAMADVIPPEESACDGKSPGDACTPPSGGTCVASTCSRLDYEHWDRDASATPPSVSYDCVRCSTSGPVDAGSSGTDAGTSDGGGGCSASGAGSLGWAVTLASVLGVALLQIVRSRRRR